MADYMSCFNLANQRALVTGASCGLGAKIAVFFADGRPCAV
jgi:NAD(P)-dependent dehydrogenase (short-subunit alcohol dehydrogenase family)